MQGKLIIFSAPSGAGKTTIVRHLLSLMPDTLSFSVSATTRVARGTEKHGHDYYFLDVASFKQKIEAGEFVEYEEVYDGLFYGTLKKEIERIWAMDKHVLFDVDVVGGLALKKQFGERALSVFVQPPSINVLMERLENRGTDTPESVAKRLAKAEHELSFAGQFDKILVNDKLELAFANASQLVTDFIATKCK